MTAETDVALLFPGQGAEQPRMGLQLAEQSAATRALIDAAAEQGGFDAWRVLRQGGAEWGRTEVMQPLLVAVSLGAQVELSRAGVEPRIVAGHSLGELSAWSATGALEPVEAVRIAATRGRLMAREAERRPGGMLALLDCDEQAARRAAALGAAQGQVTLAGCNGPDQWVLTGERPALQAVASATASRWLPVAGAWHSSAMADAVQELLGVLQSTESSPATTPFVSAATGQIEDGAERVSELLAAQLVAPFRWDRAMATLGEMGIRRFIIPGPGKILRALVRSNLGPEITVTVADTAANIARVANEVGP